MSKNDGIWSMVKLGLILAVYAAASCAVLAVVNNFTAPKIAQNQIEKANSAMKSVFADADAFEQVTDFDAPAVNTITIEKMFLAKKEGTVIGAAAQVSGPTYDKGTLIVGMDTKGIVTGVKFLELSVSPGFGLKASDPNFTLSNGKTFYGQFTGVDAKNGFTAGSNFDAITGATITSNGIAGLLNEGTGSMLKYLGKLN